MYKKNIFSLMILCLITSIPVFSQLRVDVDGGIIFPINADQYLNYGKTGFNVDISAKYMINKKISLGLSSGYYQYADESRMQIVPMLATMGYNFNENKVRPFVGLDLGMFYYKLKIKPFDYGMGDYSKETIRFSSTYFGVVPSAGLRYFLSDRISANIILRFIQIFAESPSFSSFNPSVGVSYTFK